MHDETIIDEARIDPVSVRYHMIVANAPLLLGCVTSPLLLISVPLTAWWFGKRYERLRCALTKRFLKIERGFLFFEQKTIPLEKITDLAVYQNPIMKWMGLKGMRVETAGRAGGGKGGSLVDLVGVPDPETFRDEVLRTRDALGRPDADDARAGDAPPREGPMASAEAIALLKDIRDGLTRIEDAMRRG